MALKYQRLHGWKGRGTKVVSLLSWPYVQTETNTTLHRVLYIGRHTDPNASDNDPSWVITKFITFDADNVCTKEKTLIGKWSGRATLDW